MRIGDFCEKYGLDRRSVSYWTDTGVLHPTREEHGLAHWFDYGAECEEEAKKIVIARAMGQSRVEKYMKLLDNLPSELWDMVVFEKIKEEMENVTKQYRLALEYAKELKTRS